MAGKEDGSSLDNDKTCVYCHGNVVRYVTCSCGAYLHPSCHGRHVKNCENSTPSKNDDQSEVILTNENTTCQLELENKYLKRIVQELEEKNKILQEKNRILKEFNTFLKSASNTSEDQTRENNLSVPNMIAMHNNKTECLQNGDSNKNNSGERIKRSLTTKELHKTQKHIAETVININNDIQHQNKSQPTPHISETSQMLGKVATNQPNKKANEWTVVVSSRSKKNDKKILRKKSPTQSFIGELKDDQTKLKTAPKKSFIYVSRLHTDTTTDNLADHLRSLAPEVVCEKLESKHLQYFASFKVTIDLVNFKQIMNPIIWPHGAFVTRFFHRAQKPITPK